LINKIACILLNVTESLFLTIPDLDTCALSAVRGDGSSPVWLLVCKASELVEIHHLIPSCAGPDGSRPSGRGHGDAAVAVRLQSRAVAAAWAPARTAQNACLLCFAGKQGKPLIKKTRETTAQPVFVCHLLNVPEFRLKSHFLEDTQQNRLKVSVNKQMHKQKGARATGNNSRGQVSDHQTGRQISDGKSADLLFKKKSTDLINASRIHAFTYV